MRPSSARLDFGLPVMCTDGPCGEIVGAYLHPTWRITDIVVHGRHQHGLERLVPMVLIASIGRQVEISCTTDQFDHLGFSDEGLPGGDEGSSSAFGADQMSSLPLIDDKRVSIGPSYSDGADSFAHVVGHADVARGQVHVRSGARIEALDGHLGSLRGLEVELPAANVSYLVVDARHLFGRREAAVPVALAEASGSALRVNASKRSVEHLQPPDSIEERD